jgi:hypothetical protein
LRRLRGSDLQRDFGGQRMTGGIAVVLRRRKYAVLLALLCVALAIETFSARGGFLSDAVASVLAFAIWFVVFERRHERAVMAATLIATLAISWARYLAPTDRNRAMALATDAVMSLFLWSAVFAILRDLFRTRATGAEDVLGAICGYLIAGAAWGRIKCTCVPAGAVGLQHQPAGRRTPFGLVRPGGTLHVIRLRAGLDDRVLGRDSCTRARDDAEPIRRIVRCVLHGHRRVGVRRPRAVREGRWWQGMIRPA